MIRKPQQDQLRALTGGPREQIEFVVLYNPEALLKAIHYGDQNVYIKKRGLKAAVADTVNVLQRKQASKGQDHG